MFEFKKTKSNELYLIEVNPRIWGSVNQGLQNNCNYFESLLGKGQMPLRNKACKTFLSPLIYLSIAGYALKGNFLPIYTFLKNMGQNKADVSFVEDPLGWISILAKLQ